MPFFSTPYSAANEPGALFCSLIRVPLAEDALPAERALSSHRSQDRAHRRLDPCLAGDVLRDQGSGFGFASTMMAGFPRPSTAR